MLSTLLPQIRVVVEHCATVRNGNEVLILTDESLSDSLITALRAAVVELGARQHVVTYEPSHRYTIEDSARFPGVWATPTWTGLCDLIAGTARAADVVILANSDLEVLLDPVLRELALTKPVLSLAYLSDAAALQLLPSSVEEVLAISKSVDKGAEVLSTAKHGRFVSKEGTDISFRFGQYPVSRHGGVAGNGIALLPGGQVARVPDDGSAAGRVVVNQALSAHDYKILDEPVILMVEDGNVVDIQGGPEARRLARWLADFASPEIYHVTEVSLGTNPRCSHDRRGYATEDTHALGATSLALGADRHFGASVQAPAHCDMTMRFATFELDGVAIVEDGRLLL